MNNVPTIISKTTKLEKPKPKNSRHSSGGIHRISFSSSASGDIDENMETGSADPFQGEKLVAMEAKRSLT